MKIFDDVPVGRWINSSPQEIKNNLPSLPDHFNGRSKDLIRVIQYVTRARITTVSVG